MRIAMFYHSVLSDWNHGNAHFLRGVATELVARGHEVRLFEPEGAWSLRNLLADSGPEAVARFRVVYPELEVRQYDLSTLDLERELDGVDLVIVHEWNTPDLIARVGQCRARGRFRLLFHDTHHRSLSDHQGIADTDLTHYDGVLAFGAVIRERYLENGWCERAWTWHEAADTRVFRPRSGEQPREGDLVWIGNWGDDERTAELSEFLFEPAADLGLRTRIYGVRYPRRALDRLQELNIGYGGWLANFDVPRVFGRYRVTVHVPRRPYVETLTGIPTIRPFEAMACGIPLVCSPWEDSEGLFDAGRDYLVARDGQEMKRHLHDLLNEPAMAAELAASARKTILARHTCAHRVDELLTIYHELGEVR